MTHVVKNSDNSDTLVWELESNLDGGVDINVEVDSDYYTIGTINENGELVLYPGLKGTPLSVDSKGYIKVVRV